MTDTIDLDKIMRSVLARIELVSVVPAAQVKAAALEVTIVNGNPVASSPPPYVDATHLFLARRYAGCRTDDHKRAVIRDALAELRALRYSRHVDVDRETQDGRLQIGRDPRPVGTLAYVYGYSERHIHRLRAEARKHDKSKGYRSAA